MDPDPDPRKEIEVDPELDPARGFKWIRIRPNAVDPGVSGSETLLLNPACKGCQPFLGADGVCKPLLSLLEIVMVHVSLLVPFIALKLATRPAVTLVLFKGFSGKGLLAPLNELFRAAARSESLEQNPQSGSRSSGEHQRISTEKCIENYVFRSLAVYPADILLQQISGR